MKYFKSTLLLVFAFLMSSCSVLLPYEEEPLCKIGKGGGYCGSISDVYNYTLDVKPVHRVPVKLNPKIPCHNCDVESYKKKVEGRENINGFQEKYEEDYFGR